MPIIGYKKEFKNITGVKNEIFTINFDLQYTNTGFLKFKTKKNNYFDCGDYRILINEIFDTFTDEQLKEYDCGVYILSICKYIVDKIPNVYSINYESKGMIDTYFKQEIIDDYNKIKNHKDKMKKNEI